MQAEGYASSTMTRDWFDLSVYFTIDSAKSLGCVVTAISCSSGLHAAQKAPAVQPFQIDMATDLCAMSFSPYVCIGVSWKW